MLLGICLLVVGVLTLILALMLVMASDWDDVPPPQRQDPRPGKPPEPITIAPERGDFAYRKRK
jgi:hypothetical protein